MGIHDSLSQSWANYRILVDQHCCAMPMPMPIPIPIPMPMPIRHTSLQCRLQDGGDYVDDGESKEGKRCRQIQNVTGQRLKYSNVKCSIAKCSNANCSNAKCQSDQISKTALGMTPSTTDAPWTTVCDSQEQRCQMPNAKCQMPNGIETWQERTGVSERDTIK